MTRPAGFKRTPLEIARQTRTMTLRGLDCLDRNYKEARQLREAKLAKLNEEIETLEKAESK